MGTKHRTRKSHGRGRFQSAPVSAILLATFLQAGPPPFGNDRSIASEFLRQSQSIFRGRVVNVETLFDGDTGDILTRYLFQVDETLKGEPSDLFELTEFGGTLGEFTMVVPHGATYRQDVEYVVFAWRDALGRGRTLAGSEGGLPLLSGGGGELAVRLGPNHPLGSIVGTDKTCLMDFRSFSQAIAAALERAPGNEK